jgi:DNA-binding GntR family transcriptional regulator
MRIFRSDLKPGTRLVEVELCKQLGVSRSPLREALLVLAREGLVEVQPHRGATVIEVLPSELPEIVELRALLEGFAAHRAAEMRDAEIVDQLKVALSRMEQAAADDDSVEAALAHLEFHRTLGRAPRLPRLASFIDQLTGQSGALRVYTQLPPMTLLERAATHVPIVDAIALGDAELAQTVVMQHICEPLDVILSDLRELPQPDSDAEFNSQNDLHGPNGT